MRRAKKLVRTPVCSVKPDTPNISYKVSVFKYRQVLKHRNPEKLAIIDAISKGELHFKRNIITFKNI